MGRLIDADKFKVYLQEYLHYGHAIPWLDAQPTAYDVENVVAELEDKSQYCIPINGQAFTGIKTAYAIDIVKAGGLDD